MQKVSGIGGFFFRANDWESLMAWYRDALGVDPLPAAEGDPAWRQEAGETAFTCMPGTIADPARAWSMNFRVPDLDAMVEQLRGMGTEVTVDPTTYSMGRFASLSDPEGNPLQLWEVAPD